LETFDNRTHVAFHDLLVFHLNLLDIYWW